MRRRSILYGVGLAIALAASASAEPASNKTMSDSVTPKPVATGPANRVVTGCCGIGTVHRKRPHRLPSRGVR